MRADEFREQVFGRVPAWNRYSPALERVIKENPSPSRAPEILLNPGPDLWPFEVTMLLEVLRWADGMLVCQVVVGGPPYFGGTFHVNPRFLQFFRLYLADPTVIIRSAELQ